MSNDFTRVLYINGVRHNVTHIGTRFWADDPGLPMTRASEHSLTPESVAFLEIGGIVRTSGNFYSLYEPERPDLMQPQPQTPPGITVTRYVGGKAVDVPVLSPLREEIPIKKGVPIPEHSRANTPIANAARRMEVGDCIDLPPARTSYVANMSRATDGVAYFTQRITKDETGKDVVRVWRIS